MFEDSFVDSRRSRSARKRVMLAVSIAMHTCMVSVLVLIPLFQLQVLPQIQSEPPLPPFRMPKGPRIVVLGAVSSARGSVHTPTTVLVEPNRIPTTVELTSDVGQPDIASTTNFGLQPRGGGGGASLSFPLDTNSFIPPPPDRPAPPPLPPPPPPTQPVYKGPQRVSGGVQQANLLEHPTPIYPKLAIAARVQGAVILEAVITRDGAVDSVRVVSGHPLLVQAAIDAVQQWRYRPTLLNGQPVEVITTITVNFALQ